MLLLAFLQRVEGTLRGIIPVTSCNRSGVLGASNISTSGGISIDSSTRPFEKLVMG